MEHLPHHGAESSEITIRLDDYDDIFSDFDIREYPKRALSIDFIDEVKRAAFDKKENKVELMLFLPKKERKSKLEPIIKERLAAHFKRHYHLMAEEKARIMGRGIGMVSMGIICMVGATLVLFNDPGHSLLFSFLIIFLEPASWFLLWEGMDQIVFTSKSVNPDLDFYRKMSNAHDRVYFESY